MNMGWKLFLEPWLCLTAYWMGISFWSGLESLRYRNRVLSDDKLLSAFIRTLEPEWIKREGESLNPEFGSYFNDISHWLNTYKNTVVLLSNFLIFGILLVCAISYWLSLVCIAINLACLAISAIVPIKKELKQDMLVEVQMILLYLYAWYSTNPSQCESDVRQQVPKLKVALHAIQEIAA
jgi:hypothetical protein